MEIVKYFYTKPVFVHSLEVYVDHRGQQIGIKGNQKGKCIKQLPRVAICTIYDPETQTLTFGEAICSSKDNFTKARARHISYNRAKVDPALVIHTDGSKHQIKEGGRAGRQRILDNIYSTSKDVSC